MKKAVKKPATSAGVKKMSLKDLSAGTKAGGVKGGRKNAWDLPTTTNSK